jgi:type I restriction enzyme, S subunit
MNFDKDKMQLSPWVKDIPSHWNISRLGNVANVLFSNVDKHDNEGEIPVRLCNYVDVYKNDRITSQLEFMEATAEPREIVKFQLNKNDVLATKDSEEYDDIAIPSLVAEDLPDVICGYHLALLRPRPHKIIGPYLAWLHSSKAFRTQYEAKAPGVTRFGLAQHHFKEAIIPIPPLAEQTRIVEYLDSSCEAIDSAIKKKRQQLKTLNDILLSIKHYSVTRGIADHNESEEKWIDVSEFGIGYDIVPCNWKKTKLRYEISIQSGDFASDKLNDEGDFPIYGGNGIMGYTDHWNVDGETIVVGRVGAYCGNAQLVKGKSWVSDNALIVKSKHNTGFLCHLFNVLNFNSQANHTAQPVITGTKIKNTYVMLPSNKEQQKICDYIDMETQRIELLKKNIQNQTETSILYRNSLIHECVTGRRRISEEDLKQVQVYGKA